MPRIDTDTADYFSFPPFLLRYRDLSGAMPERFSSLFLLLLISFPALRIADADADCASAMRPSFPPSRRAAFPRQRA